ncbi:hypothetical protein OG21DRAFT_1526016 [Imleria badia]|nr:hypothetical protein OG21DRAFT_1526016 [Imleria badia]
MPSKRKTAHNNSDVVPSQANLDKQSWAEDLSPGAVEMEEAVRHSSCRGRGYDINLMAPTQPPTAQAPSIKSWPKPQLKTKTGALTLGTPPLLVALGGQFGFMLPTNDIGSPSTACNLSLKTTEDSQACPIFLPIVPTISMIQCLHLHIQWVCGAQHHAIIFQLIVPDSMAMPFLRVPMKTRTMSARMTIIHQSTRQHQATMTVLLNPSCRERMHVHTHKLRTMPITRGTTTMFLWTRQHTAMMIVLSGKGVYVRRQGEACDPSVIECSGEVPSHSNILSWLLFGTSNILSLKALLVHPLLHRSGQEWPIKPKRLGTANQAESVAHPPSASLQLLGTVNPSVAPVGPMTPGAKPHQQTMT